ncbi:MAG: PD40 domain-containing protein, partial [Armatimonadetes bacterium]|nr:PD40 domain-containing protein [Armatimonadota bacterium]
AGVTVLPEGRLLTPVGKATPLASWPHGLVLSPNGKHAFVASEGVGQFIDTWQSAPVVRRNQAGARKEHPNSGGAVYSKDGKKLYWSNGDKGGFYIYDTESAKLETEISLNVHLGSKAYNDSFVNDLALSPDGKTLYCADVANFRLVAYDLASKEIVSSVPTGRYPYALAVSGDHVFVANIGQFAYSPIGGTSDKAFDPRGLTFPPFGYPSKEAENGVEVEGRKVAGLGDPRAIEAFSVFGYDCKDPKSPRLVTTTKTGLQVGAKGSWGEVVGGSGPGFLLARGDKVFVANTNNDSVEEIDARSGKVIGRIDLSPSPLIKDLQGVLPNGMALSADGKRLFVAQSGINSIAVVDTAKRKVVGQVPTAWYPYRVALSPDGKDLSFICFRGFGNGPRGVPNPTKSDFTGLRGSFHVAPVPKDADLPALTQKVLANNGFVDASVDKAKLSSPVWSGVPGQPSEQIKYVVFITKENHTYDAIFDRIKGANDDPKLLQWGLKQTIKEDKQPTLENVAVMTNHNKLAREFTVSDNFYMQPEASGVGHRWLIGVQPNTFCQMLYTVGWDFKTNTNALGRLASFGSNGSMQPEDYPMAGSMFHHLHRNGVRFRNYGEGFEFAGVGEDENEGKTGAREVVNMPMPKSLYDNTSRDFPIFNMNIPDMHRFEWFRDEVTRKYVMGGEDLPQFLNICICNDHGAGVKPAKGYPYRASWMADNDLALGKIVEFLSHTKYWKNMLILVTQDDSGGEADHVDAQRSVLLAISPYIKRGYVSHRHTTITSMHRTMYEIFGLPPLNIFDATSNDFSDCFLAAPDIRPYVATDVDARIFDWNRVKAIAAADGDPDFWIARTLPSEPMDAFDPADPD